VSAPFNLIVEKKAEKGKTKLVDDLAKRAGGLKHIYKRDPAETGKVQPERPKVGKPEGKKKTQKIDGFQGGEKERSSRKDNSPTWASYSSSPNTQEERERPSRRVQQQRTSSP